jgi:galactose mutarotase-like enzyme
MGDAVMDVHGFALTQAQLEERTGDLTAVAGIRAVTHDEGPERGVRALDVRTTAGLELEVLLDRAMDIGGARLSGVPFGWRSGNGFRHPGLHEHNDEGGLSWMRALDGLLVTGGLDHALFGGEFDASHYAYPPKPTVRHGLHGRLTAIPARLLEARLGQTHSGNPIFRIRGEVTQATVFGEHLRLTRLIELDLDGRELRLTDTVENLGYERTPHMLLYHINLGWPIVDAGSELVAPIASRPWQSPESITQGLSYRVLPEPQPTVAEQVFEHALIADPGGHHHVALLRADGSYGVHVSWDARAMPHFFEWQNLRRGQYGVGLEPSTHAVQGEQAARDDGSMLWLEHGDQRTYRTSIRFLKGAEETEATRSAIRAIGDQPDE